MPGGITHIFFAEQGAVIFQIKMIDRSDLFRFKGKVVHCPFTGIEFKHRILTVRPRQLSVKALHNKEHVKKQAVMGGTFKAPGPGKARNDLL